MTPMAKPSDICMSAVAHLKRGDMRASPRLRFVAQPEGVCFSAPVCCSLTHSLPIMPQPAVSCRNTSETRQGKTETCSCCVGACVFILLHASLPPHPRDSGHVLFVPVFSLKSPSASSGPVEKQSSVNSLHRVGAPFVTDPTGQRRRFYPLL